MRCPRCALLLQASPIPEDGVQVASLRCPGCAGRWFTPAALAQLTETVEVRLWEVRHLPDAATQRAPLSCPACGAPAGIRPEASSAPTPRPAVLQAPLLQKVEAARDRHVVMDVCPRCEGIWLDAGELEAIREEGLATALWHTVRWLGRR